MHTFTPLPPYFSLSSTAQVASLKREYFCLTVQAMARATLGSEERDWCREISLVAGRIWRISATAEELFQICRTSTLHFATRLEKNVARTVHPLRLRKPIAHNMTNNIAIPFLCGELSIYVYCINLRLSAHVSYGVATLISLIWCGLKFDLLRSSNGTGN